MSTNSQNVRDDERQNISDDGTAAGEGGSGQQTVADRPQPAQQGPAVARDDDAAPETGATGAAAPDQPGDAGPDAELARAKAEIADLKDQFLRACAETENVRKRADNDLVAARRYAIESFARELLHVKDSLELARAVDLSGGDQDLVARMSEGLDLTLKQLDQAFAKISIRAIDPAPGERLDPERHQAMTTQEAHDVPPNHIVSVIQKGYLLYDRLLRPAMVVVARAPAGEDG
jgi:molecular chaperone GrpE